MPRRYTSRLLDFSGGIIGGISDYGRRPKHLRASENVEPRPFGALASRGGTRRMTSATIASAPHTLMEWVGATGTSYKYLARVGGAAGVLARFVGTSTLTAQTTPYALQIDARLSHDQMQGSLIATEEAGTGVPFFYRGDSPANPADTWHELKLPAPAAAPTFAADSAGGSLTDTGVYYWRVRWRYYHGSSLASPVSASNTMNAPNLTANLNIPVPASPRSDYLGWTLERTKPGGTSAGPFYFVADGTAGTYADAIADADLSYQTDEVIHGEPPHFDGLIAHAGRLCGWTGSTLYVSQAIDDLEATGIANFDATLAYDFGKDDGEDISAAVRQGDRLVVFKPSSVWVMEGSSPDDFSVRFLFGGIGASGMRAAASMGSTVWFYGAFGLHRMRGNSIEPFGWVEVGHLFDTFDTDKLADVVLKNHLGQRLLLAFSRGGSHNDDMLVFDQRFQSWGRWTNIRARDILVQKVADFGDVQSFLFADPLDRDAGVGTDFRCLIANNGTLDERAADGTGGVAIEGGFELPTIDDGTPDVDKDYEAVELYVGGALANMSARFITDPGGLSYPVSANITSSSAEWGAVTWGAFEWGLVGDREARVGLPEECVGKRWRLVLRFSSTQGFQFNGIAVDAIVRPERRFSR